MFVLAHIFGMPIEELVGPLVGVMSASAVTYLMSALSPRRKIR